MSAQAAEREFELSDAEFDRLRQFVHQHTGIALSDTKRELVYGRLARRLRVLGLASFSDYCKLVESGQSEELQELTNAITTNLTSFFRESHHFEQLAGETLAQIARAQPGKRRLRIWSAGCSTGEEPYSLAIVLREAAEKLRNWDVKILATDIDSNVLATAAAGVYRQDRFEGEPAPRLKRWFSAAAGRPGFLTASPELKSLITFKRLNLLGEWPMRGPFDVIFCRNVIIYFDKNTQRELFNRMAELQAPGGWLFVGHSGESLHRHATLQAHGPHCLSESRLTQARSRSVGAAAPDLPPALPQFEHIRRAWDAHEGVSVAKILPGEYYVTRHDEMISPCWDRAFPPAYARGKSVSAA